MSMHSGMGPVWRHMRTDRSVSGQKLARNTVKRVLGFARPHRSPISLFLALTVVDAALVVVTPLLVKNIVDNGILKQDTRLVVLLALAAAGVAGPGSRPPPRAGWGGSPLGQGRPVHPRPPAGPRRPRLRAPLSHATHSAPPGAR